MVEGEEVKQREEAEVVSEEAQGSEKQTMMLPVLPHFRAVQGTCAGVPYVTVGSFRVRS